MFYSHEILTRREHGVATIWLVATLGSKSSLKKVTRKAINDVNVPKAVEMIISPDAPMALRLQGNLLYGVSRVYSQQCSYVQSDLQSFWDKLRRSSLALSRECMEIDPEAGRARPEQLNLADDPAFLPDFNISFDLGLYEIPLDHLSDRASSQLPSLAGSSHASLNNHEPQLELPSDETPMLANNSFDLGEAKISSGQLGVSIRGASAFDEPGIIDDPEFDIDVDGNLFTPIRGKPQSDLVQGDPTSLGVSGSKVGESTGITDRVRAEHEAGLLPQAGDHRFAFDDAPMLMGDDEPILPNDLPFSAHPTASVPSEPLQASFVDHPAQENSSIIQVAPQRRIRPKKAIKVDVETQIASAVLKAWDVNYVLNMATERLRHEHVTSTLLQSKQNGQYHVLGVGLSGLGKEFDADLEHPLRLAFSGQALLDALRDKESSSTARKRNSPSDHEEDGQEGRRVRPRSEGERDQEFGREQLQFEDDVGLFMQVDDDMPIEQGRNAPTSIPDIESIRNSMPWNALVSSRAGSARPFNFTSSVGPSSRGFDVAFPLSSVRGRITDASPLMGRGKEQGRTRYSSLEVPALEQLTAAEKDIEEDNFHLPELGMKSDADLAFELHGPAAAVCTQEANDSQWLASTLEDEANNFFAFLQAEIEARNPVRMLEKAESQELGSDTDEDIADNQNGVLTFEELLPTKTNSLVVAAQGFLHLLTLTTRGAVMVRQREAFGEIEMRIVDGVKLVVHHEDNCDADEDVNDGKERRERTEDEEEEADREGGDFDDDMDRDSVMG